MKIAAPSRVAGVVKLLEGSQLLLKPVRLRPVLPPKALDGLDSVLWVQDCTLRVPKAASRVTWLRFGQPFPNGPVIFVESLRLLAC